MRHKLYCVNCGLEFFEGDFKGWENTVCYKCKAKVIVRGDVEKYVVKVFRLLDPHTHRSRRAGKILLHCPHCGKAISEVTMDSSVITHCPACNQKVNVKLTKEAIYIVIKENENKITQDLN